MSLEETLRGNGLWNEEVSQYCIREELESTDDLAFLFSNAEEAEACSPSHCRGLDARC